MDVLGQVVGDGPGGVVGESDEPLELRKAAFAMRRLILETISFGPGKSPDRALVCFGFGYDRMVCRLGERNRCDVVCGWCGVFGCKKFELIHLKSPSLMKT